MPTRFRASSMCRLTTCTLRLWGPAEIRHHGYHRLSRRALGGVNHQEQLHGFPEGVDPEASELLAGANGGKTFASSCPFVAEVPAHGAAIWKVCSDRIEPLRPAVAQTHKTVGAVKPSQFFLLRSKGAVARSTVQPTANCRHAPVIKYCGTPVVSAEAISTLCLIHGTRCSTYSASGLRKTSTVSDAIWRTWCRWNSGTGPYHR